MLRVVVALALLAAACAPDEGDGNSLARRGPSTTAERSSAGSSPSGTVGPTTTTRATSTTVPAADGVVLEPFGLSVGDFGDEAATVLSALVMRLGPPGDDSAVRSCPSGEIDRLVQFAELAVLVATRGGVERFVGWDVGSPSRTRARLATAEGISVGSSLAELRSAYDARLELSPGDPFGPVFEIEVDAGGRLGGTLTGTTGSDTVATLFGGTASCGR